jgi:hypothetical protein
MKLNMLKQRGYFVLEVTEAISEKEARVLQAGLEKIFKTTKDILVLDLTLAQPEKDALVLIQEFHLSAFKVNNDLFIVGPNAKFAQFPTRKEAAQLIISGASISGIREKILGYLVRHLENRVAELEVQKEQLVQKYVVADGLPFENKRLAALYESMLLRGEELLGLKDSTRPTERAEAIRAIENSMLCLLKEKNFQVKTLFAPAPLFIPPAKGETP